MQTAAAKKEITIRGQKPIPFLEVSMEAKGVQHAVFSIMDAISETGASPRPCIYIAVCVYIYVCVCVRVYVQYGRMEAYTATPRDSLPTEDWARATYWL